MILETGSRIFSLFNHTPISTFPSAVEKSIWWKWYFFERYIRIYVFWQFGKAACVFHSLKCSSDCLRLYRLLKIYNIAKTAEGLTMGLYMRKDNNLPVFLKKSLIW